MNAPALAQYVAVIGGVLLLAGPLGRYLVRVIPLDGKSLPPVLQRAERQALRLLRIAPAREMTWAEYATALLVFSLVGSALLYLLQRIQGWLPLNPQAFGAVPAAVAFNTAISFVTNTNWQVYAGESTMSHLTQVMGLTVQNFVSAATGLAVLVALIRGLVRERHETIGNFWVDLLRAVVYVLLPLSLVLSLALLSQGVVQSLSGSLADGGTGEAGTFGRQAIPLGPAASQIAIKQLGTNGGGFFGANSAHPFENPTPLSNLLELVAILLLPAASCHMFGRMTGDRRQGRALLAAMTLLFVLALVPLAASEQSGTATLRAAGADTLPSTLQAGGNMEGKEVRHGIHASALWAAATTATSSGSVNSMHDSLTPVGGMVAMALMQIGEVVFGGAGSGLYGMLVFVLLAVFVAGLMVGRTPEYLGKKIGTGEMKLVSVIILVGPLLVLVGTAIAVSLPAGRSAVSNPGPHAFSQILYALSSMANNNGSAFGGLDAARPFYAILGGIAMFLGRYGVIVPTLALAGALAAGAKVPVSEGTLPTHTPTFVLLLCLVVIVVGALTFFPALALGPLAEALASGS